MTRCIPLALLAALVLPFGNPFDATAAASPPDLCDLIVVRTTIGPSEIVALAVARDAWTTVAPPQDYRRAEKLPASHEPRAQHFRVLDSDDPSLPGREILVTPWDVDPACDWRPWRPRDWVEPGDTVAFLLGPDTRRTTDGRPTFDVFGAVMPYPPLVPLERRYGADEFLSAAEYASLMRTLPRGRRLRDADPEELRRVRRDLDAWAEARGVSRDAFPLKRIRETIERLVEERGGR